MDTTGRMSRYRWIRNSCAILYSFARAGFAGFLQKRGIVEKSSFVDTIVISYPKSGRTWLRVMLDYLGIELHYDHDIANLAYHPTRDYGEFEVDRNTYGDKRVILLVRDPRDTVVSSYFHAVKRQQVFEGSLSEYIRSPKFGIRKILQFQSTWIKSKDIPKGFLVVRYRDMHNDTMKILNAILRFLEVDTIGRRRLKSAVELFRFDNMQAFERTGLFRLRYGRRLKPLGKDNADPNALKVRRGVVGGYVDYLSEEDIEYCDQCIQEMEACGPLR